MSRSTLEFGVDLYRLLSNGCHCNLFLSPFSISTLLSLVACGSSGSTLRQILDVVKIPGLSSSFHSVMENYLKSLKSTKNSITLSSATRAYIAHRVSVQPEFESKAKQTFEAEIIKTDFTENPAALADEINQWVSEKTRGKITNIVSKDSLSTVTAILLLNAVYFKGTWSNRFDAENTTEKPFRTSKQEQKQCQMMQQTEYFRIGKSTQLQCDVIELPYGNEELSMYVFLPFDVEGLTGLDVNLSYENIVQAMQGLKEEEVDLFLPKFYMETSFELKDVLISLGMTDAFQANTADLSGIDGTRSLFVSSVQHKTFVEVNEEGTEAAAVTSMDCVDSISISRPKTFMADHPFMFVVKDNRTEVVLFVGKVVNPEYKKEMFNSFI